MFAASRCLVLSAVIAAALQWAAPAELYAFQDSDQEARKAAEDKLESLLKKLDAFYKVQTSESGNKSFVIMWEQGGTQSKISLHVQRLGTFGGQPVFGYLAYSTVEAMPKDEAFPPSVIKLVATKSDFLVLGSYSMSPNFDYVYANVTSTIDGLTEGGLWMGLAYVHTNSVELKKAIAEARAGQ